MRPSTKSLKRPKKYEAPSWNYIYELCIHISDQIRRSRYKPDLLVAVARGGWVPGRILSDLLENPNIATIKVEYYVDIYKTRAKPEITQPLPVDIKGKKILIMDDIADSGKSLKLVKEYLLRQGASDVKICALYCKPWSIVTPDFSARVTDAWICFPHEIYETMKKVYAKMRKQGKTRKEIEGELLHIGIKPLMIERFLSRIAKEKAKK